MFFSQAGEDIFLNENIFKNKRDGVYIELGALDGVLYSNTKFFEDQLGWTGILIEPHPEKFKLLQKNRPNNFLFNELISNNSDEVIYRYFVNEHAAVSGVESTLSKHHFDHYFDNENDEWVKNLQQTRINIKPRSLTDVCKSTNIKHIDLLSLDVEGHEYEVLMSWDFSIPIDVVLIETLGVQPDKDQLCRDLLIKNGYTFYKRCQHNEVFILNGCNIHLD